MFIKCLLLLLAASFLSAGLVPPESRIIGGRRTDIKEAPWQVSLNVNGTHYCGGSIYSKWIIITAAHCFYDINHTAIDTRYFSVSVGSTSNTKGSVIGVEKKVLYPGYDRNIFYVNDIAVLRLRKPLVLGDKVKTISLAKKEPVAGTIATATGWGSFVLTFGPSNEVKHEYPEYLQRIHTMIVSRTRCLNLYGLYFGGEQTLCTEVGTCRGDSGGPLVVNRELVGVTSGASDYCRGPNFFTNVFHFRGWILSAIHSLNGSTLS